MQSESTGSSQLASLRGFPPESCWGLRPEEQEYLDKSPSTAQQDSRTAHVVYTQSTPESSPAERKSRRQSTARVLGRSRSRQPPLVETCYVVFVIWKKLWEI